MSSLPAQSAANLGANHPVRGEQIAPRMAKADLPKGETPRFLEERAQKEAYGRLLKAVQGALGKNKQEMAALLNVDDRQLGRWYAGTESPQMWRYHAIPVVRRTLRLIEALDDADGAVVETTIRARLDLTLEK